MDILFGKNKFMNDVDLTFLDFLAKFDDLGKYSLFKYEESYKMIEERMQRELKNK